MKIIAFPTVAVGRPAHVGATWLSTARFRLIQAIGAALNWIGAPGAVQPMALDDAVSGLSVSVTVSALYTKIKVNGRDFYFDRMTGRFDGTGSAL